jgi:predicted deacetylase
LMDKLCVNIALTTKKNFNSRLFVNAAWTFTHKTCSIKVLIKSKLRNFSAANPHCFYSKPCIHIQCQAKI